MTYKLMNKDEGGQNIRLTTSTGYKFIPMDESNTDYQEYLAWVAEGNTPDPADQTVYKLTNRT